MGEQSQADSIDWAIISGPTPSAGTGPSSAYDGTQYLYIEASDPNNPYKIAEIISPCFDLTSAISPTFGFNYHMHGAVSMGSLTISVVAEGTEHWTEVFSLTGNQGNAWWRANVDLSAYEDEIIRIKITAMTGLDYQGDMGIDSLTMHVECIEGSRCSDNDRCTIEDVYDADCNCVSIPVDDSDGDGLCDLIDVVPGYADVFISTGSRDSIQLFKLNNDMSLDTLGDVQVDYPYNSIAYNMVDGYIYGLKIDPEMGAGTDAPMVRISTNGTVEYLGDVTYQGAPFPSSLRPTGAMDMNDKFYALHRGSNAFLGLPADADVVYVVDVTTLAIDTFYNFGYTGTDVHDIAYNHGDDKLYAMSRWGPELLILDLETVTYEVHTVANLPTVEPFPYGGVWFDSYGSLYTHANHTGGIYRIDSIGTESRMFETGRAAGWAASLVGHSTPVYSNDATFSRGPLVTNQNSPVTICGPSTITKTFTVFNPFRQLLTFDFSEDLRTVDDYVDDATDQSASPLDGTFLPATLSGTHGGSASFSAANQEMTITGMTVPATSTITFSIQLNTPELPAGTYFSQARMYNLTSPLLTIAARAEVLSDDLFDVFKMHPTALTVECSLLPVELINFTAQESDGDILLEWNTATEVNNDYFAIERSMDASAWVEIGQVDGHGTTATGHNYTYIDNNIEKGRTYYYRLKQYDFDRTYEYSEIRHVTIANDDIDDTGWTIYPNPVNRNESLFIESSGCNDCKLKMYSPTGNLIMEVDALNGTEYLDISAYNLSSGVYLIELSNESMSERKKVMIH